MQVVLLPAGTPPNSPGLPDLVATGSARETWPGTRVHLRRQASFPGGGAKTMHMQLEEKTALSPARGTGKQIEGGG